MSKQPVMIGANKRIQPGGMAHAKRRFDGISQRTMNLLATQAVAKICGPRATIEYQYGSRK